MLLPSSSSDVSSLPVFFLSRACMRRAACDAPARFLGDPVRLAGFALTLSVRVGSSLPRRKATHPASKEAPAPGTLPNPRNCAICSSANEFLGGHVCFLSCFSLSFSASLSLSFASLCPQWVKSCCCGNKACRLSASSLLLVDESVGSVELVWMHGNRLGERRHE